MECCVCGCAGFIPPCVSVLIPGIQERSKIVFNKEKFLFTRKEVQFSGFCEVKEVKELVEDIRGCRT